MSAESERGWACSVCTFFNETERDRDMCSLCLHSRAFSQHIASLGHLTERPVHFPRTGFLLPRMVSSALTGALTAMFASVGALTGAVTGAFAGRATDAGLLRGAGLGAIAGAVLSVEILEITRAYISHERSAETTVDVVIEFIVDILTGRFVQEQLGPALLTAHRWQVNTDEMSYDELYEMFGGNQGTKGASRASLGKLPYHVVNQHNSKDAAGDNICCAICLQEMQQKEIARSLPNCQHTFHMSCVDTWLTRHGSCPICRQDI